MPIPQFISDLLAVLFDLATPTAICTMVLAGISLRREGGLNFEAGGGFQKWMLWSVILLTVPQILSWFASQGLSIPQTSGGIQSKWAYGIDHGVQAFVTDVVVTRLIPVIAAFFVLKAVLDGAQGQNPLGSVIAAMFVLAVSATVTMMRSWNSGSQFATTDMLMSLWNYLAGTILPAAAALAVVGAVINYIRHRPFVPLVGAGLGFLSVTGLWKLVQSMVG